MRKMRFFLYNCLMNRVVHFEIAVSNFEEAKKFYQSIFDWKFVSWGEHVDYIIIQTGKTDENGMPQEPAFINGGMYIRQTPVAGGAGENAFICTVEVENIDETLKKVEEAGGKIIIKKKEIPTVGFSARCKDLDDNIFGLLQPARG